MGESGEAQNITHQQKKMVDRLDPRLPRSIPDPVPDDKLEEVPFVNFAPGSPEAEYMKAHAGAGRLPAFAPAQGRVTASAAALDVRAAS